MKPTFNLRMVESDPRVVIDRKPHIPKVSPFAKDKDALAGENKSLFLSALGIHMLGASKPRRDA